MRSHEPIDISIATIPTVTTTINLRWNRKTTRGGGGGGGVGG